MNKYRVAELRKKRGWTQEVLAEKANITVRTIQRIENGTDVSLDTLSSISNALLVPVSELFERIEEEAKIKNPAKFGRIFYIKYSLIYQ